MNGARLQGTSTRRGRMKGPSLTGSILRCSLGSSERVSRSAVPLSRSGLGASPKMRTLAAGQEVVPPFSPILTASSRPFLCLTRKREELESFRSIWQDCDVDAVERVRRCRNQRHRWPETWENVLRQSKITKPEPSQERWKQARVVDRLAKHVKDLRSTHNCNAFTAGYRCPVLASFFWACAATLLGSTLSNGVQAYPIGDGHFQEERESRALSCRRDGWLGAGLFGRSQSDGFFFFRVELQLGCKLGPRLQGDFSPACNAPRAFESLGFLTAVGHLDLEGSPA